MKHMSKSALNSTLQLVVQMQFELIYCVCRS